MTGPRIPGTVLRPGGIDPWRLFVAQGPNLVEQARDARRQARHYAKGPYVGSVVLAYSHATDNIGIFTGANQNLAPGDNPTKVCAERVALQKAVHHNFSHVIAMVTTGEPQPDTQSGKAFATLHTCGIDRAVMQARPEVYGDTLIMTVQPDKDVFELYPFGRFVDLHDTDALEPEHHNDPGFRRWQAGVSDYDLYQSGLTPSRDDIAASPADLAVMAVTGGFRCPIISLD